MAELIKSERKLRQREAALFSTPKTAGDFQRALLTSPNSSYLWIRYAVNCIEHQGQQAGREILLEGMKKIGMSEEREKLNLYLAWLNYESAYGSEDSFEEAYEAALQANDPEKVMRHRIRKSLAKQDFEDVKAVHETLCRRFGQNPANWAAFIEFLLSKADQQEAERTYRRGKQALGPKADLDRVYAIALFKSGFIERGRTIMEQLIGNKPKRGDLWNLYLDMEAKYGSLESQRELFDRALTVPFNKNTIRGLFKRYITLESTQGDETRVEAIKQRARDYIQEHYS